MTLTKKIFEALFTDSRIEKSKDVRYLFGQFTISFIFEKDNTTMFFDADLSEKNIVELAEAEFGKDETGLVFDEYGVLDMSNGEIIEYLDENAERLALHIPEWDIKTIINN